MKIRGGRTSLWCASAALMIAAAPGLQAQNLLPNVSSQDLRSAERRQLPLAFEPNTGQTDPQVKFLSRGNGYTLFLTKDEAVLALLDKVEQDSSRASQIGSANPLAPQVGFSSTVVRMKL